MTDSNPAAEAVLHHRVLPAEPFETFADYVAAGGGALGSVVKLGPGCV